MCKSVKREEHQPARVQAKPDTPAWQAGARFGDVLQLRRGLALVHWQAKALPRQWIQTDNLLEC